LEKIETGEFITPFMKPGDTIKLEMFNEQKENLFGTIFQKVVQTDFTE
jgi:fumarylacetoacetate (FAA) hydrolase